MVYIICYDWPSTSGNHTGMRYLYEYIQNNHPEYQCVWFLNDQYIPVYGNAKRIRRKSFRQSRWISL